MLYNPHSSLNASFSRSLQVQMQCVCKYDADSPYKHAVCPVQAIRTSWSTTLNVEHTAILDGSCGVYVTLPA